MAFVVMSFALYVAYQMGVVEARGAAWLDGYNEGQRVQIQRKTAQYRIIAFNQYDERGEPAAAYKPVSVN